MDLDNTFIFDTTAFLRLYNYRIIIYTDCTVLTFSSLHSFYIFLFVCLFVCFALLKCDCNNHSDYEKMENIKNNTFLIFLEGISTNAQ